MFERPFVPSIFSECTYIEGESFQAGTRKHSSAKYEAELSRFANFVFGLVATDEQGARRF